VTVVLVDPETVQVTPVPDTVTVVAPIKLVPERVTGTVVPRTPVEGANPVSAGPCTVNGTELLVPPGVVIVTALAVAAALDVMAKFAVTLVSLTTVRPVTVTPPPGTVIAVAPVNPVPERVTGTVVPRTPVLGVIEVNTGVAGFTTVSVTPVAFPSGVATVTALAESAAAPVAEQLPFTVVAVGVPVTVQVTPVPDSVMAVAPVRSLPVMTTDSAAAPRTTVAGAIAFSDGPSTVNVTVLLVPPPVVAVTVLVESVAPAVMTQFALAVVAVDAVTAHVTPVPDIVTAVVPVRLVPVSTTGTVVPR